MRFLFLYISFLCATQLTYANENTCISCHKNEVLEWQQSDHFHAMETATLKTVLGNFDNQTLDYQSQQARFYTKEKKLIISMPDLEGKLTNYPVLYTFGYQPLQQYMFDMGQGKIQLFPFAWDSRAKEQGGQRWFVLHPDQKAYDLFHWSQMGQNWNHMCADCHSTDFKKQFNLETQSFSSTFSEINVSCKACHGESEQHINWAYGDTHIKDKASLSI